MSSTKFHGGGSSFGTACAGCKYQRKKCTEKCILAPYFPQELNDQFLNAHKLFGVSNITKLIQGVEESKRDTAVRNLIFHANVRALDPVGGVYRIICDLKQKIEFCQAELKFVHQQLVICRSIAQRQRQDLYYGCCSYGDLLEQGDDYFNVDIDDHRNHQEMMLQQSPLKYEKLLEKLEQTNNKVKLEKEGIFDVEENNLLNTISQCFF